MTAVTSIVGALALASTLVGCSASGDAEGVPVARDARFVIVQSDGSGRVLEDLDAWVAAVPFALALPTSLPAGAELIAAQLNLPDARFGDDPPPALTRLLLSFRNEPNGGFAVFEAVAGANPASMADDGVISIDLPGAMAAQLVELPARGGRARSSTLIGWRACDIAFELTAPGSDVLPRQEVLDLARAFIEGCE